MFDWSKLEKIIVAKDMTQWDPVEQIEVWPIAPLPDEVLNRLQDISVFKIRFEYTPEPLPPGYTSGAPLVFVSINPETEEIVGLGSGGGPGSYFDGEEVPTSQWP